MNYLLLGLNAYTFGTIVGTLPPCWLQAKRMHRPMWRNRALSMAPWDGRLRHT